MRGLNTFWNQNTWRRGQQQTRERSSEWCGEAFKIPVASCEPITLALKYGNRAAGSAYRRLDKRCDARSIRPPTDLAREHTASLLSSPSSDPDRSGSTGPQSFVMYVTRSWLLSWHSAIPTSWLARVLTPGRMEARSAWSLQGKRSPDAMIAIAFDNLCAFTDQQRWQSVAGLFMEWQKVYSHAGLIIRVSIGSCD